MSPEAQQLAMATLEGWQRYQGAGLINWMWAPGHIAPVVPRWCKEQGDGLSFTGPALMELPNYLEDLNAVAIVEALAEEQGWAHRYPDEMCKLLNDELRDKPGTCGPTPFHYMTVRADLRVKAILKALAKQAREGYLIDTPTLKLIRDYVATQTQEWRECAQRVDAKMLAEQADHNKTVDRLREANDEIARLKADRADADLLLGHEWRTALDVTHGDVVGAKAKMIASYVAEIEELRTANRELHEAYMRIRALVQSYNTKLGGTDRFEVTEQAVEQAVKDQARLQWIAANLCYMMVQPKGRAMITLPNRGLGWKSGELEHAVDAAMAQETLY